MKRHPEQKESEKLLTNSTMTDYHKIGWKTKRMGEVAYYKDLSEGPINQSTWTIKTYPVFVQVSEVEKVTNEN